MFDDSKGEDIEAAFGNVHKSLKVLVEQIRLGLEKFAQKYNMTKIELPELLKINETEVKATAEKMKNEATDAMHLVNGAIKNTQAIIQGAKNNAESAVQGAKRDKEKVKMLIESLQKPVVINRAARYLQNSEDKAESGSNLPIPEETWNDVLTKVKEIAKGLDAQKANEALKKIEEAFKHTKMKLEKAVDVLKQGEPQEEEAINEVVSRKKREVTKSTDEIDDIIVSLKDAFGNKKVAKAFEDLQASLNKLGEAMKIPKVDKINKRFKEDINHNSGISADNELEKALEALKSTFDPDNIRDKFQELGMALEKVEQTFNTKLENFKENIEVEKEKMKNEKRTLEKESDEKISKIVDDFKIISEDLQANDIKKSFVEFGNRIKSIGQHFKESLDKLFHDIEDVASEEQAGKDVNTPNVESGKKVEDVPTTHRKRSVPKKDSDGFEDQLDSIGNSLNTEHLDDCFKQFAEVLKALRNKLQSNVEKIEDTLEIRNIRSGKIPSGEKTNMAEALEEFLQEFNRSKIDSTFKELFKQLNELKDSLHARAKHLEKDLSPLKDNKAEVKRFLSFSKREESALANGLERLGKAFDHDQVEDKFKTIDTAIMKANEDFDAGIHQFREWLKDNRRDFVLKSLRQMSGPQVEEPSKTSTELDKVEKEILELFEDVSPEQFEKPFLQLRKEIEEILSQFESVIQEIKTKIESGASKTAHEKSPVDDAKKPVANLTKPPTAIKTEPSTGNRKRETKEHAEDPNAYPNHIIHLFDSIRQEIPTEDLIHGIEDLQDRLNRFCASLRSLIRKIGDLSHHAQNDSVAKRDELEANKFDELLHKMNELFDEKHVKGEFESLWMSLESIVQKMANGTKVIKSLHENDNHDVRIKRKVDSNGTEENEAHQRVINILIMIKTALDPKKIKESFDKLKEKLDFAETKIENEIEELLNETHIAERHMDGNTPSVKLMKEPEEGGTSKEDNIKAAFDEMIKRMNGISEILKSCIDDLRKDLGQEIKTQNTRGKEGPKPEAQPADEELTLKKIKEKFDQLRKESVELENKFQKAAHHLRVVFEDLKKEMTAKVGGEDAEKRGQLNNYDLEEKINKKLKELFDWDKIKEVFTEFYKAMSKAENTLEDDLKISKNDVELVREKESVLKRILKSRYHGDGDQTQKTSSEAKEAFKDIMNALKRLRSKFNVTGIAPAFDNLEKLIETVGNKLDEAVKIFTEWITELCQKQQAKSGLGVKKTKVKRDINLSNLGESLREHDDETRVEDLDKALDAQKIAKFNDILQAMLKEGKIVSDDLQRFVTKVRIPPLPEPIKITPLKPLAPIPAKLEGRMKPFPKKTAEPIHIKPVGPLKPIPLSPAVALKPIPKMPLKTGV